MSTQIPVAFSQKFRGDYLLLAQQQTSKFAAYVRDDPDRLEGKYAWFNRIGATAMVQRTSRHADTTLVDTAHSRRRVTMADFEWADLIDRQDVHRVLTNPQNAYVRNATMAAMRNKDDIILRAVNGNSYVADSDDTVTATALPAAQQIAVAAGGLTLAKMISALEILNTGEAGENEVVMAIGPKQVTDLLGITEFKSVDFNGDRPLKTGIRVGSTFLGFTIIMTNRLTLSGTSRLCLAWQKEAIGFALGEDLYTDVGPRRDKSNATQVLVQQTMGATRIEDARVIEIACLES